MTDADLKYFEQKLFALSGVVLRQLTRSERRRFFQGSLRPRLKALRLASFAEYRQKLQRLPRAHAEWQSLIDAMRINRTRFFRELPQLQELMKLIAAWPPTRKKKLRVLCCACSTGEEAYTLAILLSRAAPAAKVVGTDLNTAALDAAKGGYYPKTRVSRQVPRAFRKNFVAPKATAALVEVRPALRAKVTFEHANLLRGPLPRGRFDVIVCRNVFYYFDAATAQKILRRLERAAAKEALLVLSPRDLEIRRSRVWKKVGQAMFRGE